MPSEHTTVQSDRSRSRRHDPGYDPKAIEMLPASTFAATTMQSGLSPNQEKYDMPSAFLRNDKLTAFEAGSASGSASASRSNTKLEGGEGQSSANFTAKPDATINSPESSKPKDDSLEKMMAEPRLTPQQYKEFLRPFRHDDDSDETDYDPNGWGKKEMSGAL